MTFAAAFPRTFSAPFKPDLAADVVASWWPVASKPCVAAYQPKWAASLAASYVNLANPGTYDAAPGVAPAWASETGWGINGINQYLTTGIVPGGDQSWSALICVSTGLVPMGVLEGAKKFLIWPRWADRVCTNATFDWGSFGGGASAPFVYGFAGLEAFYNGSVDGTTIPDEADMTFTLDVYIGGMHGYGGLFSPAAGTITAVAIYSATLTAGEVATVSAAMAAL